MKKINLSLEEWELIYNPYWYRVGHGGTMTIETTDKELALSFGNNVEYLGRRKLE